MNEIIIRTENQNDYEQITKVNDLAFNQPNEGMMISVLRKNKKFIPELSLVAEIDSKVVGHILFFPLNIISGEEAVEVLSLAPMAVLPEYQQKGIGKNLVIEGLKKSKEMGYKAVVVLGHPTYYPKFGFERASKWNIKLPIEDVPDEASMSIELEEGFLKDKAGIIEYPVEYYEAL
ncbi:MAG: hypothetical protein A2W30_08140 [Ignavibacteria bacterium RBG_16_36_9]|nr:MAG: hypothetical protein A2W30_08140 [Ignavibacteria bacterium RBG_16_36_9]